MLAKITGMLNNGIATRGDYYSKTCYMVCISGIVNVTAIIMYTEVASVPTGIPTSCCHCRCHSSTSHQSHITSHNSSTSSHALICFLFDSVETPVNLYNDKHSLHQTYIYTQLFLLSFIQPHLVDNLMIEKHGNTCG